MPGRNYQRIARALLKSGISETTACLIISRVSEPQQTIARTDLSFLGAVPPLPGPVLLIVGEVAATAKSEDLQLLADAALRG
jgi:siroheme synthase